MDKKLEMILHEVNRQFKSERAFYQTIGITQRAWEKIKSGDTDFNNVKLSTYQVITTALFTRYETMLLAEAVDATNYNWYENIVDAFHDIKLIHAKAMLERGASIETAPNRTENGQPKRKTISQIRIVDELNLRNRNGVSFEVKYPSSLPGDLHLKIPSGQLNRREWFEKEFEKVVVK